MNVQHILEEIEKHDPEVYGRLDTRRSALREFGNWGKKIALTSVAVGMGSLFKKAYGQTGMPSVFDVLNYALTLEYLEADFYAMALRTVKFPNARDLETFGIIADHEAKHVKFLQTAIQAAGGRAVNKPRFDFSGGVGSAAGVGNGPFKNAFSDYGLLLAVAQVFEDTGVRAYKGQARNLVGKGDVLTAALNIHSVEARHAAHIRLMRRMAAGNTGVKPWITGSDPGLGAANALVQASYAGEDNTNQAGIEITNINGMAIEPNDASESFDEPLSMQQVLDIVKIFIVG